MNRNHAAYEAGRRAVALERPVPIWQDCAEARWLVPVASDREHQNPWSGWCDVNADATTGVVEMCGVDFTPDEARSAAHALMAAADHVELFVERATSPLFRLISPSNWPEIDHLPIETQRMIRGAVAAATERIRKSHDHRQRPESER